MNIKIDDIDHATILAALRYYQKGGQGDPGRRSLDIHEIATAGGNISGGSHDDDGIDELCETLNCAFTADAKTESFTDEEIAAVFWDYLDPSPLHRDRRFTAWGDKTKTGLAAVIQRLGKGREVQS